MTTIADPDANFHVSLTGLSAGNYIFSVYGEDDSEIKSPLFNFSVFITKGVTTNIGSIFIAPTIGVNKKEVRRGDDISIFGKSAKQGEITIVVNSEEEHTVKTKVDNGGVYLYNFDTSPLEIGDHAAKFKAAVGNAVSKFSNSVFFQVGSKNISAPQIASRPRETIGDSNGDGKINLIDFSVAAYWYESPEVPPSKIDLNKDGKIDLVDFSIMAYYWTG